MKTVKQRSMLSPKAKEEPKPLIATRRNFYVLIAESQATWLKNTKHPQPDAPSAIGPEEATS